MKKAEFLNRLEEIMNLDAGTLRGNEVLAETGGWDSMSVVQFIALADEDFGVSVPGTKLLNCKTVPDLMALLDGELAD